MNTYELIRSRRKTLALELTREGRLIVGPLCGSPAGEADLPPPDASETQALKTQGHSKDWIARHPDHLAKQAARPLLPDAAEAGSWWWDELCHLREMNHSGTAGANPPDRKAEILPEPRVAPLGAIMGCPPHRPVFAPPCDHHGLCATGLQQRQSVLFPAT